jgi:hypothetical protein
MSGEMGKKGSGRTELVFNLWAALRMLSSDWLASTSWTRKTCIWTESETYWEFWWYQLLLRYNSCLWVIHNQTLWKPWAVSRSLCPSVFSSVKWRQW